MVFVFPYYCMYMPSMMKSWMERVFSMGFAYGGRSLSPKKALFVYATGAPQESLKEIEPNFWHSMDGMMKFMGVTFLKPFTAYQAAFVPEEQRAKYLTEVERIAINIDNREPYSK